MKVKINHITFLSLQNFQIKGTVNSDVGKIKNHNI
jgi:hypothetical protein